MKVLLYNYSLNRIGGVETFCINFCKRLCKYYEITFVYEVGDNERALELSKYATVEKYTGQKFDVDICIYSSAWGNRPEENITAKRYIQICHADYKEYIKGWNFVYKKTPKVTEHVCVGENVAKSLKELHGYDSTVIYNLLDQNIKIDKVLKLVTTSRISWEKGFERIIKMAKMLKQSGKKFTWFIYGSGATEYVDKIKEQLKAIPEVIFMGSNIDVLSYVADADYLVQLSDTEGFCYSIYEALQVGTACIVTNFPSAKEQVTDGKNGYIVDMELSNLDIEKIYSKIPKEITFKEKSSEEDWIKLLGKPDKEPKKPIPIEKPKTIKVKATQEYYDIKLERLIYRDEPLDITQERADYLIGRGLVKEE